MKRNRITAIAAIAAICSASSAWAQTPAGAAATGDRPVTADQDFVVKSVNEEAGRVMSAGSPNSRAGAGYNSANVQFTSESGETDVSVAFSFDLERYKPARERDGYFIVSRTKIGLVASTPIDKGKTDSALFSGDSLVSGSKLKFSLTTFRTKVGSGFKAAPFIGRAYARCVRLESAHWSVTQNDRNAADLTRQTFVDNVVQKIETAAGFFDVKMAMTTEQRETDIGKYVLHACQPGDGAALGNTGELITAYGDDPVAFRHLFLPDNAKLTFWGIDASMGREDHTYLDRAAFKLPSAPRTSWEVGAYYGWISSNLTFSLRGRAVYGQTYEDNDAAEICRTVSIPAGTECIKGPDGAPLRQRIGLVSVEARKLVTVNGATQIAVAPQVTYRTEDKNFGVEIPVYLVPDKDGKLSGGLKAVYNSKGDEFAIGVFVGVPFSIFYN